MSTRPHVARTAAEKCRALLLVGYSLATAVAEQRRLAVADGGELGWERQRQAEVHQAGSAGRTRRVCRRSADGDQVEEVSMTMRRGSSDVGSHVLADEKVTVCCR